MEKTADLAMIQKMNIDTLHKEGVLWSILICWDSELVGLC